MPSASPKLGASFSPECITMATSKPRITISITPEQYAILDRLSSLKGGAKSTIVVDILEASIPILERTANLLEALEKARRENYLEEFVASLNKAEATLAPLVAAALDQMDLPLAAEPPPSNTGVTSPSSQSPTTPAKATKAPSRAASRRGKRS